MTPTLPFAPPFAAPSDAPVGVFDSGVGGLSVLRHIRAQLPNEHLMYFADSAYAPYGAQSEAVLTERSLAIAAFLVARGAKALVVACNTATIAGIKAVRARYPQLPVVGVEPGLKPGAAASRNGKVAVLATASALRGEKLLSLREQVSAATGASFHLQPCVGLADQIDKGELDTPATRALLERYIAPLIAEGVDTLVLGCTHYPFVLDGIEAVVRAHTAAPVSVLDTGEAVARQLSRLLDAAGLRRAGGEPGGLVGYTSAAAASLSGPFAGLLGLTPPVEAVSV